MSTHSDLFARILVPVDFMEADPDDDADGALVVDIDGHRIAFAVPSLRAVQLATAIAADKLGTVRLCHATPPMQTSSLYTGPLTVPTQVLDEIHERAEATSRKALEKLCELHCTDVQSEIVVVPASPLAMVLEQARTWHADLVVMAASGRSRVARFFVGSTADRVIRQAGCPVLVVPTA